MSKINLRALITALFALTFLVSACAGSSSPDKSSQSTPAPQPTPAPKTRQMLLIWHPYTGPERDALEQIRQTFAAANPMIDVQLQAVDAAALPDEFKKAVNQGAGPDLVIGPASWLMPLAGQGLLQPFGLDFLDVISSNLTKPVARATLIDGQPYATAFSSDVVTLYYNHALVENPPGDYTDLLAQATLYKLLIPPTFWATSGLYLSTDSLLMDEQGHSLITPPALEAYFTALAALAGTPGVTFTTDQTDFLQRRAGLLLASSRDYRTLKAALGSDLGAAKLPLFSTTPWQTLITVQAVMFSVNSTAESSQAARTFIVFLTKSSTQRDWFEQTGDTPVNPAELAEDDARTTWADTLEWGMADPLPAAFYATLLPALDQGVTGIVVERKDPAAVTAGTLAAIQSLAP